MNNIRTWEKHFQISTEHANCTLSTALKKQWVNEKEYQEWASQHYGLPVLKSNYFETYPHLDQDFWNKIKSKTEWNESLIPICEWNHILYVACLEPQELNIDQKTVFLISSLQDLESFWSNIPSSQKNTSSPLKLENDIDELSLSVQSSKEPKDNEKSTSQSETKQEEEVPSHVQLKQSQSTKSSAPAHLKDDDDIQFEYLRWFDHIFLILSKLFLSSTDRMNDSKKQLSTKRQPHRKKKSTRSSNKKTMISSLEKPQKMDIISNHSLESSQTKKKPHIIPMKVEPHPEKEVKKPDDIIPIKNTKEEIKSHPAHSKESPQKLTNESKDLTVKDEEPESVELPQDISPVKKTMESEMASEEKSNKTSTQFVLVNSSPKEVTPALSEDKSKQMKTPPIPSKSSASPLSSIRQILEETRERLDSYILFICKGDKFIPYKWSSNLNPNKKAPGLINTPSIFRICYRSQQPYFGNLAPILANNSFFEKWGFESLPQHIVLIPFLSVDKKKVLGGYLGISTTHTLSINFLDSIKKSVEPLSEFYEDGSLIKKVS